jgi:hypothetical protein
MKLLIALICNKKFQIAEPTNLREVRKTGIT